MIRRMSVGSELDSYCGKCKMVLNHVVSAMVDDAPRRVRCLTCQSEHNHRIPGSSKTKKSTTKRSGGKSSGTKRSTAAAQNRWHQAVATWDGSTSKAYNIYETFQVDDWVSHVTFGNGLVIEVPSPDKIITLFESGEKMLMQGRQRKS